MKDGTETIPNQNWNYWAYTVEGVFFISSSAFWEPGTVLPAYLSGLVSSPVLLGLGPAIKNAGWMLPQLVVAGYAEGLSRKKPIVILASVIGRIAFLGLPLLALAPGVPDYTRALAFLGLYGIFCFAEGITAVPWTEMLGRAVPARLRGRLLGNMQSLAGVAALLAGLLVRLVLTHPGLRYPVNYALLFSLAAVLLFGSGFSMYMVREPAGTDPRARRPLREHLRGIPGRLRANPAFRRLLFSRLLAGSANLALPFYILYGRQVLGLPAAYVGNSVAAQMLGSVAGGLLWARVSYRWGYRPLILASCLTGALIPAWTLLAGAASAWPILAWLAPYLFLMTYVTIGLYFTSVWVGFTNYLLEIVAVDERPTYIGILSTLVGPTAFLAAPGGVLVGALGYTPVFVLAMVGSLAAAASARLLPAEQAARDFSAAAAGTDGAQG
ncbi:MAG: MFS transporter [Bacillota bacterium]|nr:MFS transporter [Bacillota bacterium]